MEKAQLYMGKPQVFHGKGTGFAWLKAQVFHGKCVKKNTHTHTHTHNANVIHDPDVKCERNSRPQHHATQHVTARTQTKRNPIDQSASVLCMTSSAVLIGYATSSNSVIAVLCFVLYARLHAFLLSLLLLVLFTALLLPCYSL